MNRKVLVRLIEIFGVRCISDKSIGSVVFSSTVELVSLTIPGISTVLPHSSNTWSWDPEISWICSSAEFPEGNSNICSECEKIL